MGQGRRVRQHLGLVAQRRAAYRRERHAQDAGRLFEPVLPGRKEDPPVVLHGRGAPQRSPVGHPGSLPDQLVGAHELDPLAHHHLGHGATRGQDLAHPADLTLPAQRPHGVALAGHGQEEGVARDRVPRGYVVQRRPGLERVHGAADLALRPTMGHGAPAGWAGSWPRAPWRAPAPRSAGPARSTGPGCAPRRSGSRPRCRSAGPGCSAPAR